MRILFLGASSAHSTSRQRCEALRRLGHDVRLEDPYRAMSSAMAGRVSPRLHFRTGYVLLQRKVGAWAESVARMYCDVGLEALWVDGGELFGPRSMESFRKLNAPMVLYNVDDPTGSRDGQRFRSLLAALPRYALCVAVRPETRRELIDRGAVAVHQVWRGYDEVAHRPFESDDQIPTEYRSDVAFVGTWMRGEDRDGFLLSLARSGLDVAIWGDRWSRSPLWRQLRSHWRGPGLAGRNYVAAIQGSKVALGLLSKGNRDRHTTRSLEIPYVGGLLCAERTGEHTALYRDGVEALMWDDVDECARLCHEMLKDARRREEIRRCGAARVRQLGVGNEDVCRDVLNRLEALTAKLPFVPSGDPVAGHPVAAPARP